MILALTLLLAAQPADCRNAMTFEEIDACASRTVTEAEQEMNRAAALLMREMQATDRANRNRIGQDRLIAAQRTWIAYRDAQCALDGLQAIDAALQETLIANCRRTMTQQRATDLRLMTRR